MTRQRLSFIAALAALAMTVGVAHRVWAAANVPSGLSYSGLLKNNGAVESGAVVHNLEFQLFDGSSIRCTDLRTNTTVTGGRFDFNNLFSSGCTLDQFLASQPALSIRVVVDGVVLSPPQPIGTVPYSARARVAETVESLPVGSVVKVDFAQDAALQNVSSPTIPDDDTIPQSTEGVQVFTTTFTPTSATDQIHIQYELNYGTVASAGTGRGVLIVALFKDNDTDAMAVSYNGGYYANGAPWNGAQLNHMFTAGTTNPITIKVRIGFIEPFGNVTINGHNGARYFGGKSAQRMRIMEVKG
jgi:hypothetical protein